MKLWKMCAILILNYSCQPKIEYLHDVYVVAFFSDAFELYVNLFLKHTPTYTNALLSSNKIAH